MNAVGQRYLDASGLPFQGLKLVMIFACFFALDTKRMKFAGICFVLIFVFPFIHAIVGSKDSINSVFANFVFFQKIAGFPVFCLFMEQEMRNFGTKNLYRLSFTAYCLIVINLILSVFGLGFSQYGDGRGGLGFFISGNEVTALQLTTSAVLLGYIWRFQKKWYALACLFVVFFGTVKGTKSGMGGSILLAVITPLILMPNYYRYNIKSLLITVIAGPFALIGTGFAVWFALIKYNVLGRWIYFLDKLGLVSMLFSTRNTRIVPLLSDFNNGWTKLEQAFGKGAPNDIGFIEIDFLDILQSSGILGIIIVYGILLLLMFVMARRATRYGSFATHNLIVYIFIFLFLSNTAGHVVYAGTTLPFIAILYGLSAIPATGGAVIRMRPHLSEQVMQTN
jgi:hypothetical protein